MRRMMLSVVIASGVLLPPAFAKAQAWRDWEAAGSLVSVSVEVDGTWAPLFASGDAASRFYLEAREGSEYAVSVRNRSGERIGVMLVVDGLNVITGQRQSVPAAWRRTPPGRMYVLDPWESTTVRGWRTSLSGVRRFTFVDERASYAARSGKANGRMGWVEVLAYREREADRRRASVDGDRITAPGAGRDRADGRGAPSGDVAGAERREEHPTAKPRAGAADAEHAAPDVTQRGAASFPGTGWGDAVSDPAIVVRFRPERRPTERITLRYEYEEALIALGILPRPWYVGDRLRQRDRGEDDGFAEAPLR